MSLHTGTVTRPRWESRPYRPSPARREHINGRIVGLPDRRDPLWWRVGRIIILACVLYAIKLTVVG